MKSPFKLAVPQPCHEKWDEMIDKDTGKFCGTCQKPVVDFTGFSDSDIIQWFKKEQGNTCGRFNTQQLNRSLYREEIPRFWPLKPGLAAASIVLILGLPKQSLANSLKFIDSTYQSNQKAFSVNDQPLNTDSAAILRGKVVDELNHEVPGVIVRLKNTEIKAVTDAYGKFSFTFNSNRNKEIVELEIKAFGFEPKSTSAIIGEYNLVLSIKSNCESITLGAVVAGGIIVKRSFIGNIWYRIKNIFD
jgi:hypothetical protein